MVYVLNLAITVLYFYFIKKMKKFYLISTVPILFLWTIILGGQYEVGTDYRNYLNFYYGIRDINLFYLQKEYIFYYFMKITSNFFEDGQIIFIIIGGIESFLFFYFIKKCQELKLLTNKTIYIFLLLFLSYGTIFYNQMNMLRQYFDVYLFSLSYIFYLNKNKCKCILLNIIAILIHRGIYVVLPFYFIYSFIIKKRNTKFFYIGILIISFILSSINIIEIIKLLVIKYLPVFKDYFIFNKVQEISFEKKIIKYIYLPFYLWSVRLLTEKKEIKNEMLKIGILSYAVKIAVSNMSIVYRIGEYFSLLAIFPIYYLLEDWLKKKKYLYSVILLGIIISIFLLKVTIFAKGEYLYRFYLFNNY